MRERTSTARGLGLHVAASVWLAVLWSACAAPSPSPVVPTASVTKSSVNPPAPVLSSDCGCVQALPARLAPQARLGAVSIVGERVRVAASAGGVVTVSVNGAAPRPLHAEASLAELTPELAEPTRGVPVLVALEDAQHAVLWRTPTEPLVRALERRGTPRWRPWLGGGPRRHTLRVGEPLELDVIAGASTVQLLIESHDGQPPRLATLRGIPAVSVTGLLAGEYTVRLRSSGAELARAITVNR